MGPDEQFIQDSCCGDGTAKNIYQDYLKEHGQESLAAVLANLDLLIKDSLRRNLSFQARTKWHYHSTGQTATGVDVFVYFQGELINSFVVPF